MEFGNKNLNNVEENIVVILEFKDGSAREMQS